MICQKGNAIFRLPLMEGNWESGYVELIDGINGMVLQFGRVELVRPQIVLSMNPNQS